MNISEIVKNTLGYTKKKAIDYDLGENAARIEFSHALAMAISDEYQPKIAWHRASELPAGDTKVVAITNDSEVETGWVTAKGHYVDSEGYHWYPLSHRIRCWALSGDIANTAGGAL